MSPSEKTKEKVEVKTDLRNKHQIIIFNDDVNTFDFVIDALINTCEHSLEQAEQCTMIIHYNGKCGVKTGSMKDLKPRYSKLLELGLSASIK
ncbi:MAG: ATP-dependent Clp protease adaptor ClpS, partial [Flavobacteriales bacterium]|nr:ATP-dependent Clp protease adaptor ClpS [Flavobacteriales bacterium]